MKATVKFALLLLLLIPSMISVSTLTQEQKDAPERLKARREEYQCMMVALHYESGNQPVEGIKAVAEVIRNRANRTGDSWCATISKRKQFSFLNSGKIKLNKKLDKELEHKYYPIAVAEEDVIGDKDVIFYHATYVSPTWSKKMEKVVKIKDHIFYKLKEK